MAVKHTRQHFKFTATYQNPLLPSFNMHALNYILHLGLASAIPASRSVDAPTSGKRDACPRDLPALPDFEFPHLIVPISAAHPDTANANSYFPTVSPGDLSTIFNFDIARSDQTCELGFYFPRQDQLETSSYTFYPPIEVPATVTVTINQPGTGAADGVTTYNNRPPPSETKIINMSLGNYYSLWSGVCPAGVWSITISSGNTGFCWFQDYNPCPIGPYVVYSG
jgi:hypothetical protein